MLRTISVMSADGDSPLHYDTNDKQATAEAKALFDRLVGEGFRMFAEQPGGNGGGLHTSFTTKENLIAVPRITAG